jgi:hypothetical protein
LSKSQHDDNLIEVLDARSQACSTILYLSDAGSPTIVLDQQPGTALASAAWLVRPQPGRLAAFDGSLLHGVLPGKASQAGNRTTLVLAFWTAGRQPATGHPGGGPARHPPWRQTAQAQQQLQQHLGAQQTEVLQAQQPTWPAAHAWHGDSRAANSPAPLQPCAHSPQHLAPAWVLVPEPNTTSDSISSEADVGADQHHSRPECNGVVLPLPPLRFFLTSETEFWDVYGK